MVLIKKKCVLGSLSSDSQKCLESVKGVESVTNGFLFLLKGAELDCRGKETKINTASGDEILENGRFLRLRPPGVCLGERDASVLL